MAENSAEKTGRIWKATGGFYYVLAEGELIACRGRGLLRKEGISPAVGDLAEVQLSPDGTGTVVRLFPRKNALVRPPLANLDQMVVVVSVTDPAPNLLVTDTCIAVLEHKGIEPVICATKADLGDGTQAEELASLYRAAGFTAFAVSSETGQGVQALRDCLAKRFSAFSGNSGVGKTSLLNAVDSRFSLETGEISKKLGRGRHTTRHVEIFTLQNGGLVADTPGFSSIDPLRMSDMRAAELAGCFREFAPHVGNCRFADCAHIHEKGCAVLQAMEDGAIAPSRHKSYTELYEQLKDVREWERQQNPRLPGG